MMVNITSIMNTIITFSVLSLHINSYYHHFVSFILHVSISIFPLSHFGWNPKLMFSRDFCNSVILLSSTMETKRVYDTRWQYWSLVIIIYTTLVAMGVVENARSVGFVIAKEYFDVSYLIYGFLNSCLSFSYIVFCFLASLAAEKISYKWVICIGFVLIMAGCFGTHFASSYFIFGACMFIVWMGFGCFEIGSNAASTIVFVENQGTMMSLMHFFFGIGAVIGPNVARWSMNLLKNSFYSIYLSLGVVVFLFFLIVVLLPFRLPRSSSPDSESKPALTVMQALRQPSVWLCSITMGMMQTVESSGASWAPLYLVDVLGYNADTDVANFTTMLYIIFTVSRLVSGPMIDRMGYYSYLYLCLAACFVLLGVGFLLGRNGIWLFAMSGFFYSATWPVFICVIMGYYKESAPTVTSVVIVLQGIMLLPMNTILGWLNKQFGDYWAYRLTLLFCVVGALLLTCVYYSQKRKEAREKKELPVVAPSEVEKKAEVVASNEKKTEETPVSEKVDENTTPTGNGVTSVVPSAESTVVVKSE